MKIHLLEIPDDLAQRQAWLDAHLAGPDLGELVAELSAVHASGATKRIALDDVIGADRARLLQEGTRALPAERLRQLLMHPGLLLELQELVLSEGGRYWEDLSRQVRSLDASVTRGSSRLGDFLETTGPTRSVEPHIVRDQPRWYAHPALVSLATAAALLLAFFAYEGRRPQPNPSATDQAGLREKELEQKLADERRQLAEARQQNVEQQKELETQLRIARLQATEKEMALERRFEDAVQKGLATQKEAEQQLAQMRDVNRAKEVELQRRLGEQQKLLAELQSRPVPGNWGWNRTGAPEPANARAYLDTLAAGSQEWFKKKPDTRADLAQRIAEFRQGCSKLILAEHRQLAQADKSWLVRRCKGWAGQIDRSLTDLEAGKDMAEVRKDMDDTVNRITEALRARAADLG